MSSCTFSRLETLPPLESPLTYLSIATSHPDWDASTHNWPKHLLLQSETFQHLPALLSHLETGENFALSAKNGPDSLEISSSSLEMKLTLSEQTYSHNSYVGRYLKFIKHIPPKKSADIDVFYTATTSLDTRPKHSKDVSALIVKVFATCSVVLLLDEIPPFDLTEVSPLQQKSELTAHSDLSPLSLPQVSQDIAPDVYEYLCLLHLNGLPDTSNSHVQATNTYVVPTFNAEESATGPMWLHVTRNINPGVLKHLLETDGWVTAFARTEKENIVLMKTSSVKYIWHVQN